MTRSMTVAHHRHLLIDGSGSSKFGTMMVDVMIDDQTLAAAVSASAAGSGCPADGIVAAVIGIAAAFAALKTPCMREPRGNNTEDDMLEEQFAKWYAQIKDERFWS
jgi:hypothetical protein